MEKSVLKTKNANLKFANKKDVMAIWLMVLNAFIMMTVKIKFVFWIFVLQIYIMMQISNKKLKSIYKMKIKVNKMVLDKVKLWLGS